MTSKLDDKCLIRTQASRTTSEAWERRIRIPDHLFFLLFKLEKGKVSS
jgi:hypothetical protein